MTRPWLLPVLLLLATVASAQTTGPPSNAQDAHRNEALRDAAMSGDIPLAARLLAAGADINAVEPAWDHHSPLALAAENGQVAMTRFLLAHGADADGGGIAQSPLFWAVCDRRPASLPCVRLLLKHGADAQRPCGDNDRPIDWASENGDVGVVCLLADDMPMLTGAQRRRYVQQARNVALDVAAATGTMGQVRAALAAGADINNRDGNDSFGIGTPLMRATLRATLPLMRYLLAHGAQVNLGDGQGRTALMYTGRTNMYYGIVSHRDDDDQPGEPPAYLDARPARLLLQCGASLTARDRDGRTALMYAAEGNPQAVAALLAAGAAVNATDDQGRTALLWAASVRDGRSSALLLEHGASVNAQDKRGESALMLASVMPDAPASAADLAARRAAVTVLRRSGANGRLKDGGGKTAADYARMVDDDFNTAS